MGSNWEISNCNSESLFLKPSRFHCNAIHVDDGLVEIGLFIGFGTLAIVELGERRGKTGGIH